MGYTTVASLRGKRAEDLYAEECALRGCLLDRCQLYLYRAVLYFVNTPNPNLEKCKWWYWKDEYVSPSPCGVICVECSLFPIHCEGCRKIKGRPHWLQYTGDSCCAVYDCCVNHKHRLNCGGCASLPCYRFTKDPTVSDEQNMANLKQMLKRLSESSE